MGGDNFLRQRGKADLDCVVIVEDEVDHPHEIEGDDEKPEERTYSYREKRQDGEHPSCQVPVGGERGEASGGQIRGDGGREEKDEPERTEAGQRSKSAVRREQDPRPEPAQEV